jgi:hypothetical protein
MYVLQSLQKAAPSQVALTLLLYTLVLFVFTILADGWVGQYSN